jgi:fermentation-respiration switch protein FrsA (DUF1100 family)
MAHGLSGTRRDGLGAFARRFAAAGIAALVFDHRGFGDSTGVCVGECDQVAKPGPAIAAAHRAPLGELRTYPGVDHFDIYDGPHHEKLLADQLAFLNRHLRLGPSPAVPPGSSAAEYDSRG